MTQALARRIATPSQSRAEPPSWPWRCFSLGWSGPSGHGRGRRADLTRRRRTGTSVRGTFTPTRPTKTPARGWSTSATRLASSATARSRTPTTRTRWADRWRRSEAAKRIRRPTRRRASFEAKGLLYTVERRDGRVFHKATRRGADGDVLAEIRGRGPLRARLGDARHHLPDRARRLPLPVADRLVRAEDRWDISPGYGEVVQQPNFERAIHPDCLFCHTNRVRPVTGTLNRYEPPIFEGHAIGCERCHGPGALHVEPRRLVGRARPDDRQPGRPGPRAAGFGLPAMPSPGLVPLPQGGP